MKISTLLNDKKLTISFEVFPPKTDSAFSEVEGAVRSIAALGPSFMSVTYGAGGGTSKYTLNIAKEIKEDFGVPSLAHLTCVGATKTGVRERIAALKTAGIENIMALRGDLPPSLSDSDRLAWDYRHASDLIRDIREISKDFCIGGACYPEGHPESSSIQEDIKYLRQKVDAGCAFLTTQMFFDNSLLYNFLYRIREAGITVPVIPGIMPITSKKQIERARVLSGSYMPHRFLSLVDRFGDDPAAMRQAGVAYATDQIIDLFAGGITHVHIYSMNSVYVAERILCNLSDILGK